VSELNGAPRLDAVGLDKRFDAVHALAHVDLQLFAGEVHALLGENGAGKSTLVKILGGIHRADAGEVRIDGEAVDVGTPPASRAQGIAVVHQDPILFGDLTVAENIYLERLPRRRGGPVDWRRLYADAQALLDGLGVRLSARRRVEGLTSSEQQLVEIARALSLDARVLVLDEATSALSAPEVDRLFGIVRSLRADGVAIAFVGHRLEEVFALADRITVLRDGARVITAPASELTPADVIRHMVGRRLDVLFPKTPVTPGETVLAVRGLTRDGRFADVSFELRRGEILGFAGLVGAGRTEVAHVLFGLERADAGEIELHGERVVPRAPADMLRRGLAYVPEDRHRHGVILEMSVSANVTLPVLPSLSRRGLLDRSRERAVAGESVQRLQVKAAGLDQELRALSGGNQQKVVLAKWLLPHPAVLILDDPTRGIDVGTKAEVHRLMSELAADGLAIVLISNELPEVMAMSDRVLVFQRGRVAAAFDAPPFDEEAIMAAAIGAVDEPAAPAGRAVDGSAGA
jgi:rhamnose transport system ATP-binding protein